MAVEGIGIYPNKRNAAIFNELALTPSSSAPALEFRFATQSDAWLTANVWVTVDAVRKAGNEAINGYYRIGAHGAEDVALSSFTNRGTSGGNHIWAIPVTASAMAGVRVLLGTLTYSARLYDAIRLTVEVRVVWGTGDGEFSKSQQTCYIGFKPNYVCTGAQWSPDGLSIGYTASGWNRPNDRWENNAIRSGGKLLADKSAAWGTVGGAGVLVIPADKCRFAPSTGETLSGTIRMVGSWQDVGAELGTLNLAGVEVENLTEVDPPTLTVSASGGSVTATAVQADADRIDVGMVGSTYSMDRASLDSGASHEFRGVPAGVETEWYAVAVKSIGGIDYASDPVYATASPVTVDGLVITPEEGDEIAVPYNGKLSSSTRPETEEVKLAGRDRPTVGFGEGGEVTWTLSGTIVAEEFGGLTRTDEETIRALPFAGLCMMRDPNGWRTQVYIKSAGVANDGTGSGLRTISISAEEVA